MTLGRADDPETQTKIEQMVQTLAASSDRIALLNWEKDLKADWSKPYGLSLIFRRVWESTGFRAIIQDEFRSLETEFDVPESIFNMTLSRLTEPCSKRGLQLWQKENYSIHPFELHQYYRAMDYLIEKKESIEQRVFSQMRDLFCQNVDIVLFDTTTLVYYGEGEEQEVKQEDEGKSEDPKPLLAHGFSKAKRYDLKQVVVGIAMSKDGIPLAHEVFSGNTNDVSCFKEVIDQLSKKFQVGKVILVGDRGMISQKNVKHLDEKGYQYILGFRMRTIPKDARHWVLSKLDLKRVRKDLSWKEVSYQDQRLLVCFNPERAVLDAEHRERILEKIRKKIKDGSILSVVDNPHYKKFLKIKGEKPKLDLEQIERDAMYDGLYVLTSNTKMKGQQIIDSYKDLWQVESAFRQLKSELEAGPIFHWKDDRIRAHVMICFLALILRTVFYKQLRKQDSKASYSEVFSDLRALCAIGLRIQENEVTLRTELQPKAVLAFKALGMNPPKHILSSSKPLTPVVARL